MIKCVSSRKLLIFLIASLTFCANLFAQDSLGEWMEAENNPSAPIKFAKDKNASGGMITWGSRWYRLAEVPLPTNKAVYVYINAKTMDNKKQYFQLSNKKKNYRKIYLPVSGKWCWAKLGLIKSDGLPISIRPNGVAGINSYLDGFVISNGSQLTDEQLNKIKNSTYNGKVAIGKCSKAPVIDGKLDDACWKQTVVVSPFSLNKSAELAREQTKAYLTYDDKNIYAGFRCYAIALEPAQNRLHEFIDKVKKNDSNGIFKDDCVIILFSPEPGVCYELTVNANGAIIDAKCKSPNYWKNRDLKWNSGAVAKGSRENGFWTVEIAVPRSVFGKNNSNDFKFVLGRINQAAGESSSFSRIDGFHDPASFSSLIFRKSVPTVGLGKFPAFSAGENKLPVNIGGGKRGSLLVEQLIRKKGESPKLFTKKVSLYKKSTAEAPFKVSGGDFNYVLTLRDGASSDILLKTPSYSFSPTVSVLKAAIKSPSKYQFFLNTKEKNNQLNKGLNVLALKAQKGTSAKITIGSKIVSLDSSWKFSSSEGKDWNTSDCNVSKWQKAPVKNGVLQQNGYLRKIIFAGETELWPNWNQHGVNICRGSSQQFFFPPRGLKGIKNVVDFKMNIELPCDFELLGASSYYSLFKTPINKLGTVKRNGVEYNKYQISLPSNKRYKKKLPRAHKYCMFAVRAPLKRKTNAYMYYYASADSLYIEEIPQKLKISLLPKLYGKQPKKVIFQLWVSWLRRLSDLKLKGKIVADCRLAGFNEIEKLNGPTPGIRAFSTIGFSSHGLHFSNFVKKHPDMALIDSKGIKNTKMACPSILLHDSVGRDCFQKVVADWLKKNKYKHIDWDYEYNTFDGPISCYCSRCLKAFGNGSLSPAAIKNNHKDKWIDFMTGRMADIAGRLSDNLHKVDPEIVFSVYSGYQSGRTKSRYGVDWSKLKGKIQLAMCGYGRPGKLLEATYKAIGDTKLLLGAIARPNRNTDRSYPTYCSAARLMRRLLDSKGGGVLIFSLSSLDGRTFYAMSKLTSLVAPYENFFIKGKRVDSAISYKGEYAVLKWEKQKLLILLNRKQKDYKFKIDLKKANGIFDFYGNKKITDKYISGSISPGDIKAYIIK
jgi:hypothetical protein